MGLLINFTLTVLQVYNFILLARVLMSWLPIDRSNPTVDQIVRFIYDLTEPVLAPIRRLLPQGLPLDLSPIIVFLAISFLTRTLSTFLFI